MAITALPTPPSRSDPATFVERSDAFLGALPTFATEANALATDVSSKQVLAGDSANLAGVKAAEAVISAALAQSASQAVGAIAWVSGTTYAIGDVRYSPINFQNYRRSTNGAGTTDPSLDVANWVILGLNPSSLYPFTNSILLAQNHAIALYF